MARFPRLRTDNIGKAPGRGSHGSARCAEIMPQPPISSISLLVMYTSTWGSAGLCGEGRRKWLSFHQPVGAVRAMRAAPGAPERPGGPPHAPGRPPSSARPRPAGEKKRASPVDTEGNRLIGGGYAADSAADGWSPTRVRQMDEGAGDWRRKRSAMMREQPAGGRRSRRPLRPPARAWARRRRAASRYRPRRSPIPPGTAGRTRLSGSRRHCTACAGRPRCRCSPTRR